MGDIHLHKTICLFAWKILRKLDYGIIIKNICGTFFAVRCSKFELGSDTTQLIVLALKLSFKAYVEEAVLGLWLKHRRYPLSSIPYLSPVQYPPPSKSIQLPFAPTTAA
jgi:hypothetical protein